MDLHQPAVNGASLVAQTVKRLPTMQETRVRSLGREDPLEKEMATHSSTLAWKIPWRRSLVGYSPWGRKESDRTERLHFHLSVKGFLFVCAPISFPMYPFLCCPYGVAVSCPTLCDPIDCSPPGPPSVRGIPQARILERAAIPFSRAFC